MRARKKRSRAPARSIWGRVGKLCDNSKKRVITQLPTLSSFLSTTPPNSAINFINFKKLVLFAIKIILRLKITLK